MGSMGLLAFTVGTGLRFMRLIQSLCSPTFVTRLLNLLVSIRLVILPPISVGARQCAREHESPKAKIAGITKQFSKSKQTHQ